MNEPPLLGRRYADLGIRIVSGVALGLVALGMLRLGGFYFAASVALCASLMVWELRRMIEPETGLRDAGLIIGAPVAAISVVAAGQFGLGGTIIVLGFGLVMLALRDRDNLGWMVPGLFYISFTMAALVALRLHPAAGFSTVLWLILVVIGADVGGYFAGRRFGGPKLAPRISPKKTWSGLCGGMALALLVGVVFWLGGWAAQPGIIMLSLLLALAALGGDLLESAVKRHFGVKDASNLIPGHGGLLDRFDGLMGALLVYAIYRGLASLAV